MALWLWQEEGGLLLKRETKKFKPWNSHHVMDEPTCLSSVVSASEEGLAAGTEALQEPGDLVR